MSWTGAAPDLFAELAVRRRAPGQRTDGRWVPGPVRELVLRANVQPARPWDLQHLPEGTRTRAAVAVISEEPLRPGDEAAGVEADRIVHAGFEWEVQAAERHPAGLPHWRAVCTRAERPLAEPAAPALAAPVLLSAALAPGGVALSWSAAAGADRYVVERAHAGAAPTGTAAGAVAPEAAPPAARLGDLDFAARFESTVLSGLDPGHPRGGIWLYRVRAAAAAVRSLPSNAVSVNVP